jgi:Tfp pilus assembly protein PilZ
MREQTRRIQSRVPVRIPVVIEHGALYLDAVALNLGLGGVFVEARPPLRFGTRVNVLIQLPELTRASRLAGVVRWNNASGCGIQFLQLGARETYAISMVVALAGKRGTAA